MLIDSEDFHGVVEYLPVLAKTIEDAESMKLND